MYDPEFEAMSLDEAYLDVTHLVSSSSSASQVTPLSIANEIRERVLHATGLTCSVGGAANKLIAKICRSSNTLTLFAICSVFPFFHSNSNREFW